MLLLCILFFTSLIFFFASYKKILIPVSYSMFIAFTLRTFVTILFWNSTSGDVESYIPVGDVILAGVPSYPSVYFPFIFYLSAAVLQVRELIPPIVLFKIIFAVFDAGVVYLLYKLTKDKTTAFLYAVLPFSLINTSIHGHMDPITIFFWILAMWAYTKKKDLQATLLLSFAVFTKPWPMIFALPFFKYTKRPYLYVGILLFPLIFVVFHSWMFDVPVKTIITMIKSYRGVHGVWGIGQILYMTPSMHEDVVRVIRRLFFVAFAVFALTYKSKRVTAEIMGQMLFFFVWTVSFGVQWLMWIIVPVLIEKPKSWRVFVGVSTLYLACAYGWNAYPESHTALWFRDSVVPWFGLVLWGYMVWMFKNYIFENRGYVREYIKNLYTIVRRYTF